MLLKVNPWNVSAGNLLPRIRPFEPLLDSMGQGSGHSVVQTPACDIEERDESFLVEMDLPGFRADGIEMEASDTELFVWGRRTLSVNNPQTLNRARNGLFERHFVFPVRIDSTRIAASLEDGVLRIDIPKLSSSSSRRVPIKMMSSERASFFTRLMDRFRKNGERAKETGGPSRAA